MKVLYLGCFCEPTISTFIKECTKGVITVSATTFQKALLAGCNECGIRPDYIVNVPDIGSFPFRCNNLFFSKSKFEYASIKGVNASFFNVTYLKKCSIYHTIMREAKLWLNKNREEKVTILVYSLIYPYLKAAIDLKKMYPNVQICCIVLDLPEYFGDSTSLLYRFLGNLETKRIYSLVPSVDSFVLLTKYMREKLNVGLRPSLLLEGIYNPVCIVPQKKRKKTILYTGKLDIRFGIRDLIKAFNDIDDSEFVLWICGFGLDRIFVEEAAKKDKRIIYWGVVEQKHVFEMQQQATLLVNPRKGHEEYTKYSFPSKIMEYMASGTPTIMYKLPGLPIEYEEYLVLLPDNSQETLTAILKQWGSKTQAELYEFGEKAKRFILENKNSEIQASRLMNFIKHS